MNKLISIIIPAKNGEKYLRAALDGIRAQGMDVETIVVDDGSDDSTGRIAREYGCTVVRNERSMGPVQAKNAGLELAGGEYVMFHDHDDLMRPGSLKALYDALEADPDAAAVEAKVKDFFSPELSGEQKRGITIKPEPFWGLFTGAILIRKSAFDAIGPWAPGLKAGEIIDWQFRMDRHGLKVRKLDFVATDRRIHGSNFGRTDRAVEFRDYAAVLRARLGAGKK